MNSFVKVIYPKKYLLTLSKKIKRLGNDNKMHIDTFLITRLLIEFVMFIGLLLIPVYGIFLSFLFTILFHYLYEDMLINSRLLRRAEIIKSDLESFMKLYLLGLERSNDAFLVFKMVSRNIDNDLTKEINYLLPKYNNYNDIVTNLVNFIPEFSFSDSILLLSSKDTKEAATSIIEKTEQDKRIELEKNINSIPVKIIFISIVFLLLVLLIILLGPKYL